MMCYVLRKHFEEAQLSMNTSFHLNLSMTSAPTYSHPALVAQPLSGHVRTLIASQVLAGVFFFFLFFSPETQREMNFKCHYMWNRWLWRCSAQFLFFFIKPDWSEKNLFFPFCTTVLPVCIYSKTQWTLSSDSLLIPMWCLFSQSGIKSSSPPINARSIVLLWSRLCTIWCKRIKKGHKWKMWSKARKIQT